MPSSTNQWFAETTYKWLNYCWQIWHRHLIIIRDDENNDARQRTYDIVPEQPIISCIHPHGMYADGLLITGAWMFLQSIPRTILVHSIVFYTPILNIIMKLLGMDSIDATQMNSLMAKGRNLLIIPGGNMDMVYYRYGHHDTYLSSRKGFIKYALKYGYAVQPIYNFSESSLYKKKFEQSMWEIKFGKSKNPIHIGIGFYMNLLHWGKTVFLAQRVPIFIVIGKLIEFPKIDSPTSQDIDQYHAIYCTALQDLFKRYINKWNDVHKTGSTLYIH